MNPACLACLLCQGTGIFEPTVMVENQSAPSACRRQHPRALELDVEAAVPCLGRRCPAERGTDLGLRTPQLAEASEGHVPPRRRKLRDTDRLSLAVCIDIEPPASSSDHIDSIATSLAVLHPDHHAEL